MARAGHQPTRDGDRQRSEVSGNRRKSDKTAGTLAARGPAYTVGQVSPFAPTPADGWVRCNGTSLVKTDYKELYEKIGTTYGGAATTFDTPTIPALVANVEYYIWTGVE